MTRLVRACNARAHPPSPNPEVPMFKRFARPAACPAFVVRDRFTHRVLIKSTREKCLAYISAFGDCYLADN